MEGAYEGSCIDQVAQEPAGRTGRTASRQGLRHQQEEPAVQGPTRLTVRSRAAVQGRAHAKLRAFAWAGEIRHPVWQRMRVVFFRVGIALAGLRRWDALHQAGFLSGTNRPSARIYAELIKHVNKMALYRCLGNNDQPRYLAVGRPGCK